MTGEWFFVRNTPLVAGDELSMSREPLIQNSRRNTAVFVYLTLAVTFLSYARFCTLVIRDITNYLGIACFTVRKKDKSGEWVEASAVDAKKH